MTTIYALKYTSDPYEPSGILGLFNTQQEYALIKHQEHIANTKRLAMMNRRPNDDDVKNAKLLLTSLLSDSISTVVDRYPLDLTLSKEELEKFDVVCITIGEYKLWT